MKIESVYQILILKRVIDDLLTSGSSLSESNIEENYNAIVNSGLSTPRFSKDIAKIVYGEEAIADDWKDLLYKAKDDIEVLFSAATDLITTESILSERWDAELTALEKEVKDLTNREQELLHHLSDTTGYFSSVGDDFASENSFKIVDQMSPYPYELLKDYSSVVPARIDVGMHTVSIPPATDGSDTTTKIDLHDIDSQDIKFTVQSLKDMASSVEAKHSELVNIFSPRDKVWKHIVRMKKPGKVTGVLQAKISNNTVDISKIEINLHTTSPDDSFTITPQYSTDGKNWYFIPNINLMKTGYDTIVYTFSTISTGYIRFIIEKDNYDYEARGLYTYEFGIEEIRLYNDSFSTTQSAIYQTNWMYPKKGSNILEKAAEYLDSEFKFTRASIEVCEDVPEDTEIDYYLSVDQKSWHPVDPINRPNPVRPVVVDFTERGTYTVSGVAVAYDSSKTNDPEEIFPGRYLHMIEPGTNSIYITDSNTFADRPYIPSRIEHGLLDYILHEDTHIVPDTMLIWRNVGEVGDTLTVRDDPRGWRVEGSYYTTVVKINSTSGLDIDLGNREASVDGGAPVRGKINIPYGIHTFSTHQDNWAAVDSGATSLSDLIQKDPLYPYNHRLLIEGYSYGSSYDGERIYRGVDRFAAYLLKPTDLRLFKTLPNDEYGRYALVKEITYDSSNKYTGIVVKFDPSNDDFVNEKFVYELIAAPDKWDKICFMAILRTRNSAVTPVFSKYVIRLSL